MRVIIFMSFFLMVLLGCTPNQKPELRTDLDQRIVLVNYGTASRKEISFAIDKISECDPKIIGLNVIFENSQDINLDSDSLLARSIRNSNKVILTSLVKDDLLINSSDEFYRNALGSAFVSFGMDGDQVTCYKPFQSVGNTVQWSLPMSLVIHSNISLGSSLLREIPANVYYDILYNRELDGFKVVDFAKLDTIKCADIADKIILFGYLGPNKDDIIKTPMDSEIGTYRTVILANIVLNILDQKFIR